MGKSNERLETVVKGGVCGTSWYDTLSAFMLVMMQHRSLVWRMHSLGFHSSQRQKPHCLQHLQQQQEQHIHIVINKIINKMLPYVDVNILKCSVLLAYSLLINSCIALIFTPTIFSSSTEEKYWSVVSVVESFVIHLALLQSGNRTNPLMLGVKCPLWNCSVV